MNQRTTDGLAVDVAEPAILIRINKRFHPGIDAQGLYESTRGVWRMSARREKAEIALAVFEGEVKEVYVIDSWHPAGTTEYTTRTVDAPGRWEFLGRVAPSETRDRYLGRSVAHYFNWGNANPVLYVKC